ncbi:sugar-binding transcriptional regulator [Tenuibacillus multivorans]|uniref:Central glycolytic genes regulator n=1 Tax=Tenuibacillus multivorans TaxID=237069 RepID=A0A1H0DEV4_9BACI|nr:sugar-binding domain-containing protein [Tenuibacillus multivorans]GEL76585.1 central glycolytic genes regulator [Tenuibacillus multivorans]SDN68546.1 central glycolytic genes regulator [Tenuibacillus multivorans]
MDKLFQFQKKLVPDLLEVIEDRYQILKTIYLNEPIGRRALAEQLNWTERQMRSEIEFLDEQKLIKVTNKGMWVSEEGQHTVVSYPAILREISDLDGLETQLRQSLPIQDVKVVPGDADQSKEVKQLLGKAAAQMLANQIKNDSIVTVTGGSTMAAVADHMRPVQNFHPLFVPARGGLGDMYEYQASSICVQMAKQVNGSYRLLYVPDTVGEEIYSKMMEEPAVKDVLSLIEKADFVIHGIGDAMKMAKRRKASQEQIEHLKKNSAVGEAFGYYFDQDGKTIHQLNSIGMTKEHLTEDKTIITVAGGTSKCQVISAFFKWGPSDVLIIDEAMARHLLNQINQS